MADPSGFLKVTKAEAAQRSIDERVGDWHEVSVAQDPQERAAEVAQQARRCMGCGIPFCHSATAGCPLGNFIPEWNDLVRQGHWNAASEWLHATNNFPEFTGRLCPAPCESACVLSIAEEQTGGSVTIKRIENTIVDQAWRLGFVKPQLAGSATGKSVAVVGSGPAGLAAAQQLTRAGHRVTVFERDDRLGGLLRYGVPEFKLEKATIERRLDQMRSEGTSFVVSCDVGVDLTVDDMRTQYDAVVLALGALQGRDYEIEGRQLEGIHLAMDYLVLANRECEGDAATPLSAAGKHVVIIGGGDTGADCLGTAHRQGAASVTQLDYHLEPPQYRDPTISPWPTWPLIARMSPAHHEGGTRHYQVAVQRFLSHASADTGAGTRDAGHDTVVAPETVAALELAEVSVERVDGRRIITPVGRSHRIACDMALLAIGFDGVEAMPLLDDMGISRNQRGVISCGSDWQTSAPGVFVCGDAHRGASLVVWAIAEGRAAARAVDSYLMGHSDLPEPVRPNALPLMVP